MLLVSRHWWPLLSGMGCHIEVLFTPAEFHALRGRDLGGTTCVVFDILRATSTIVTGLANGAAGFMPVEEISEALAMRRRRPDVLLAGERDGLRIGGALSGGVEFDLGNSPREFTPEKVGGRMIISTTTNGTRALRSCLSAQAVVVASFLNLSRSVDYVVGRQPSRLLLVCAGTGEHAALEDTLTAGAFCEQATRHQPAWELLDSARIALQAYEHASGNLSSAINGAENARRLLANPLLRDDVEFCLRRDLHPIIALMTPEGVVQRC